VINNKIAILGGTGFIGSNLTQYLIEKNYCPLIIGRNIDSSKYVSGTIQLDEIDIAFSEKILKSIKDYDTIIWLVDNLVPGTSMDSLGDSFIFNTNPVIRLLEGLEKRETKTKFIFMSSGGSIYGDINGKSTIVESQLKTPKSSYGLSKLVTEQYINYLTKKSQKIHTTILRPSNVYGSGQNFKKAQGIIGYGYNAIINNKTLDLYGRGNVVRDFVHVNDLIDAIWLVLNEPLSPNTVNTYNVGANEGHTIHEVLELMEKISGKIIQKNILPERAVDCNYNILDCSKIRTELNWYPKIQLETGLEELWKKMNKKNTNS
jgi:UDP-glucose 4-epimerase